MMDHRGKLENQAVINLSMSQHAYLMKDKMVMMKMTKFKFVNPLTDKLITLKHLPL
jgi:hypothetical protein